MLYRLFISAMVFVCLMITVKLSAQQNYFLQGKIFSGGSPLKNASISVLNSKDSVITGESGEFSLFVKSMNDTLIIRGRDNCYVQFYLANGDTLTYNVDEFNFENLLTLSLEELMNIKVSVSTLSQTDILKSPSTVSFIDKQMIKDYGFSSISDALNYIAGMGVLPTYHRNDLPTSRGILQNHYANKVLVLLNGIPLWDAVTGTTNVNIIDIEQIERIEVLKGPASVLYGSNAFAGAINIVFKANADHELKTYATTGDNQYFSGGGSLQFKKNKTELFVAASTQNSQGKLFNYKDYTGKDGAFYPYHHRNHVNVLASNEHHSFMMNYFNSNNAFLGAMPRWNWGMGKNYHHNGLLFNYEYAKLLGSSTKIHAGVYYNSYDTDFGRSGTDSVRMGWNGDRQSLYINSVITINPSLFIEGGLSGELRRATKAEIYLNLSDSILSKIGLEGKSAFELSAFAQVHYNIKKATAVLGTRVTKNEYYGINSSSRGTIQLSLTENSSLKLIAGQSFRAPSLFEIHVNSPSGLVGNTKLKPETSNSIEGTFLLSKRDFFIQALYYYAFYYHKIGRIVDGSKTTYINNNQFKAQGIELEMKYMNPKILGCFFTGAYVLGKDDINDSNGDRYFHFMPKFTYSAGASKQLGKQFNLAFTANGWGENENGDKPAVIFDLNTGYNHKLKNVKIQHKISVKNLMDKTVYFPEYTTTPSAVFDGVPVENGYNRRIMYTLTFIIN